LYTPQVLNRKQWSLFGEFLDQFENVVRNLPTSHAMLQHEKEVEEVALDGAFPFNEAFGNYQLAVNSRNSPIAIREHYFIIRQFIIPISFG
jgi:hypothetical protein